MKMNDVFPSKFVKADDLKGKQVLCVISHVTVEKIGDDTKPVIYFQGKEKGLVCNKTNFGRIAYVYGDESDEWTGKEIVLYPEMTDFQGKPMWAIRVKPPEARAPVSSAPAENGNYAFKKTSGVTIMESNHAAAAAAQANRVPGSANTSVDLDQEIPF